MIDMLAMALAAAATPATPLTPSGKWQVEYEKDMCIVSRSFGPSDDSLVFAINPTVDIQSSSASLFFIVRNTRGAGKRFGRAKITPDFSTKAVSVDFGSGPVANGLRGYRLFANGELMGDLAKSSSVSVILDDKSYLLKTGKVQPVIAALDACKRDLLKSWGFDDTVKAEPAGSPENWFPWNSYPGTAMSRHAQGRTTIVLTVSADGRPTACRIVTKAAPDLDAATCELGMRNARFKPAPNSPNRYAAYSVRWELAGY